MSGSDLLTRVSAIGLIVFFAWLLGAPQPALAQFTQQGSKLVGTGNIGNAEQGWSVALSANGSTAAVGGIENDGGIGGVWIFTRTGSAWTQQTATPLMATGAGVAQQGSAVALSADGNTLIVGGESFGTSGAAWIFTRSGTTWTEQAGPLIGNDATGNAFQGVAVALSADGNTAVVGGSADNGSMGAAWIWTRSGSTWTQVGTKLVGSGAIGNAIQGSAVAISGDASTVLIGGKFDNSFIGATWVFTQSGGVWSQQGSKLVGTGFVTSNATHVLQAASVALSNNGNTAIVGGPGDNFEIGAAWVFTRSGTTWTQTGSKLTPNDNSGAPAFGNGLSLSAAGNLAIIGGGADNAGIGAGWAFFLNGGAWIQQQPKLVGTGFSGMPTEGNQVALSSDGSTFLSAGVNDDSNGAVWVFAQPVPTVTAVAPSNGPTLGGTSVAITGTNFTGVTAVDFGSTPAASFMVNSVNSITATSPPGNGTVDVTVTTATGTSATSAADEFSYSVQPPTVTAVAPANGPTLGGTSVTITGTNLLGATAVNFGSTPAASFTVASASSITATLAHGIGTVDVTVTTTAGTSAASAADRFSYQPSHDFNGDGKSDVLWRDNLGNVGIWLMNGASIAQTGVLSNVPAIWSVVGQRDFNGDGDADILWRDTSGDVGIWLMSGSKIGSTTVLGNVPTTWSVAATGDFNADGKGDIVWRDTAGNVGLWLMNGTTIVQSAAVASVPTSWVIAAADMKGDIFWRNTSTGEVGQWVMKGAQIAQSVDFGAVPSTWTIAGTGDFDGNGSTDILWRDSSGNVGIWLMNGTQIMSTKVLGNVSLIWSVAQTGDFNGDGNSDILWVDNAGNVGAWLMNGTTISSVVSYGNVGASWNVQSLNAE